MVTNVSHSSRGVRCLSWSAIGMTGLLVAALAAASFSFRSIYIGVCDDCDVTRPSITASIVAVPPWSLLTVFMAIPLMFAVSEIKATNKMRSSIVNLAVLTVALFGGAFCVHAILAPLVRLAQSLS